MKDRESFECTLEATAVQQAGVSVGSPVRVAEDCRGRGNLQGATQFASRAHARLFKTVEPDSA
jgi:hypothetical protein